MRSVCLIELGIAVDMFKRTSRSGMEITPEKLKIRCIMWLIEPMDVLGIGVTFLLIHYCLLIMMVCFVNTLALAIIGLQVKPQGDECEQRLSPFWN